MTVSSHIHSTCTDNPNKLSLIQVSLIKLKFVIKTHLRSAKISYHCCLMLQRHQLSCYLVCMFNLFIMNFHCNWFFPVVRWVLESFFTTACCANRRAGRNWSHFSSTISFCSPCRANPSGPDIRSPFHQPHFESDGSLKLDHFINGKQIHYLY